MGFFLGATNLSIMIKFIDATYGVHDDFKSCTGAASTVGYGVLSSMCVKKKLNTKISNEAELVVAADYFPK